LTSASSPLQTPGPEIVALLAAGGFDASLGARPMKRTLSRLVENPLADLMLRGDLDEGDTALVGVEGGEITVDALSSRSAAAG
jgi:ATP-dependent Clp protease ATP-binding subunit ClpC